MQWCLSQPNGCDATMTCLESCPERAVELPTKHSPRLRDRRIPDARASVCLVLCVVGERAMIEPTFRLIVV